MHPFRTALAGTPVRHSKALQSRSLDPSGLSRQFERPWPGSQCVRVRCPSGRLPQYTAYQRDYYANALNLPNSTGIYVPCDVTLVCGPAWRGSFLRPTVAFGAKGTGSNKLDRRPGLLRCICLLMADFVAKVV